ncbi:thioesterase family protein [Pestalotiopsis sp. NC0098]|nr:thioesterase family protein [Pestalotiopsis sp. NC0098]
MKMAANILEEQINLKETSSHSYTISSHRDWSIGPTLHGGSVAAAIHHAASTHLATTLAAQRQPDILTMHFQFLRSCGLRDSAIAVTDLRLGAGTSDIQLQLSQGGEVKVIALATAVNFDTAGGPSAPTSWTLAPRPRPVDLDRIRARRPDGNWLPVVVAGEVVPLTRRILCLNPRDGFPRDGVCDAWNSFLGGERIGATHLALMADIIPSLPDTLLRNGGLYDARANFSEMQRLEGEQTEQDRGAPVVLTNNLRQAAEAGVFNHTVTLDLEFKRRLPPGGVEWIFTRAEMRMLRDGRGDVDVTLCDENLDILVLARQVVLVLESKRKFGGGKEKARSAL